MKRYLFGWSPPNDHEAAIQHSHREAVAQVYSSHNKPGYRRPAIAWKARGRAFALFDQGYSPKDISPRRVRFVKRKCPYVYYAEWQTIAKAEYTVLQLLREICEQEKERRAREWSRTTSIEVRVGRSSRDPHAKHRTGAAPVEGLVLAPGTG